MVDNVGELVGWTAATVVVATMAAAEVTTAAAVVAVVTVSVLVAAVAHMCTMRLTRKHRYAQGISMRECRHPIPKVN